MIFILTEFIGIKTAIKEIILQLIVMIFFIVVIKTYLAFIWNYKNKKNDAVSNSDQKSKLSNSDPSQHIRFNCEFLVRRYYIFA